MNTLVSEAVFEWNLFKLINNQGLLICCNIKITIFVYTLRKNVRGLLFNLNSCFCNCHGPISLTRFNAPIPLRVAVGFAAKCRVQCYTISLGAMHQCYYNVFAGKSNKVILDWKVNGSHAQNYLWPLYNLSWYSHVLRFMNCQSSSRSRSFVKYMFANRQCSNGNLCVYFLIHHVYLGTSLVLMHLMVKRRFAFIT